VAIQVEYSLVERSPERELLPMAQALDLGITAWSPLGSGLLTGKYTRESDKSVERRLDKAPFKDIDDEIFSIAREVDRVADEIGQTSSQVALNWVRQQGAILPIIGARTLEQFKENLDCLDFSLDAEQIERLKKVSQIEMGFPYDFLAREMPHSFLYGGLYDQIEPR
jgi:aryl-alcohol dehydrogenase-like predicted oxidoreductase